MIPATERRDGRIGVRWTIGDVSQRGFEALELSVWGALGLFGTEADYVICFNGLPLEQVRGRARRIPDNVRWHDSKHDVPAFLRDHVDARMTEGTCWKLAPLRMFPDRYELALDNDCILWALPAPLEHWLDDPASALVAADVRRCLGVFDADCGPEPSNSGIRGLAPHAPYERALRSLLAEKRTMLRSELDEQGLQIAAIERIGPVHRISAEDVAISSPFPPHMADLGRCGVHFVGTNVKHAPWNYEGAPATELLEAHFRRHLPTVRERVRAIAPDCPQ